MFKRIEKERELALFHYIWMTVWKEKGYEFEFPDEVLDRRLIVAPDGAYCGTAEIRPYASEAEELERIAPFSRLGEVAEDPEKVVVADRIALLPNYRGKQIQALLSSIVYMSEQRGARWCAALLEPVFCRALRITFKVPMTIVGPKQPYKGDFVVPVLFPVEEIYRDPERHEWLSYAHAHEVRQAVLA
ncbi:hypothetical protein HGI30_11865 [Paenibacillus albicereus]|uniref:GNAT family N-acetyltransferase n=1 Tax=Paenibacillus albicereus TaxID=2726185 RepID=A0A6H2GXM5_9BACL|nr:hypothetical protein [Paenibacillus albicereus]QJC52183.1 hypothetical protein HGI30_11865 [Paenibacillus albicereus]